MILIPEASWPILYTYDEPEQAVVTAERVEDMSEVGRKTETIMNEADVYKRQYYVWRQRYQIKGENGLTAVVYGLAGIRILLCMMPQNQWLSAEAPLSWGIYRNLPFAMLGLLVIVLFYHSAKKHGDGAFRWMWLTIVLSFGFYIPVVLWADTIPMIGMLMIPKTCAYVWTVLIGYFAMKKECR